MPCHLVPVADVVGNHVLAGGHPRAPVRVHDVLVLDDLLHGPEEVPHVVVLGPVELGGVQLFLRPLQGGAGLRVEVLAVEHHRLLVVAEDGDLGAIQQLEALAGVRAVADDVPQAHDPLDPLAGHVVEHRAEGLDVGVDVGEQGNRHAATSRPHAGGQRAIIRRDAVREMEFCSPIPGTPSALCIPPVWLIGFLYPQGLWWGVSKGGSRPPRDERERA